MGLRIGRAAALAVAATALGTGAALGFASPAFADYGQAVHEVEISANLPPGVFGAPGTGGGIWLWIQLRAPSTGFYNGADCLHHSPLGPTGATPDFGTVTWTTTGSELTITGVTIGATHIAVTITVPTAGHETVTFDQVFTGLPVPPGVGTAQVTVAP